MDGSFAAPADANCGSNCFPNTKNSQTPPRSHGFFSGISTFHWDHATRGCFIWSGITINWCLSYFDWSPRIFPCGSSDFSRPAAIEDPSALRLWFARAHCGRSCLLRPLEPLPGRKHKIWEVSHERCGILCDECWKRMEKLEIGLNGPGVRGFLLIRQAENGGRFFTAKNVCAGYLRSAMGKPHMESSMMVSSSLCNVVFW